MMEIAIRTRRAITAAVVALAAAMLAAGLLAAPASASTPGEATDTRCEHVKKHPRNLSPKKAKRALICLINKRRTDRKLAEVKRRNELRQAAQRHTRRMRKTNCFSHQCNGERPLAGRVARSNYLPCRCSWTVGENIAWGTGRHGSPRLIVKRWMGSPAHRRNILTSRFTDVGVGFLHGRPGKATRSSAMYTLVLGDKR